MKTADFVSNMNLSVVIPTYNESENIKKLIAEIAKVLKKQYAIIIVDDSSPDGTAKLAEEMSRKFPITVIKRKGKKGLSSAVIAGINGSKSNLVCVMDADSSHPPALLKKMRTAFENDSSLEMAIASRHVSGGGVKQWPLHRKLTSAIAAVLARPLTEIKDPLSGFFMFKKSIIKNKKLHDRGFKILLDIIVKSNAKRIIEIPYLFENRKRGKSKLKIKVYGEYLAHLGALYLYALKKKRMNRGRT